MPGYVSVRAIIENFIETVGIPVKKDENYEFVMGLYDNIMAVPYNEYKELLYTSKKFDELLEEYNDIRNKYYADVVDWCDEDENC